MTHLSTSQPGDSKHGLSRLASMICSVFLALTLLLASGPLPAVIGAKDQQRHGSHGASPRGDGKANERGDSRQKPRKGASAKKGKPAAGKGKRQGKKGAKGKKKDHHREKGKSKHQKHQKHQKHKGQHSKGGDKGGNKDHGKNEKQTPKNKKAQDRHKHEGKKGPKSAHHRGHGGNKKERSKRAKKPDERAAPAMTASADGEAESAATGTEDATVQAERQSDAEPGENVDPLDGPVRTDEPTADRERGNSGTAGSGDDVGTVAADTDVDATAEGRPAADELSIKNDAPKIGEISGSGREERQDGALITLVKPSKNSRIETTSVSVAPAAKAVEEVNKAIATAAPTVKAASVGFDTSPVPPENTPRARKALVPAMPNPPLEPAKTATPAPAPTSTQEADVVTTAIERPMPEPPRGAIEELPVTQTTPVTPVVMSQEDPALNDASEPEPPATIATATPVATETPNPTESPSPEPPLSASPEPSPEAVSTATPTPESSVDTEDGATATPMPTATASPIPTIEPTAEPLPTALATPVTSSKKAKPALRREKSLHRKRAESTRAAANQAATATPSEPKATATATPAPPRARASLAVSPTPEPTVAPPTPTPEPATIEVLQVETPPARVEGRSAAMPEAPPVKSATALAAPSPKPSARSAPQARLSAPELPAIVPEATAIAPPMTPVALAPAPEPTPVGVDVVTIDAVTSNHEVIPGEPVQYRFQLTNTADVPLTVLPEAINSHDGWAGVVLRADGDTMPNGELTLGPERSALVIVAVTVPADARVGDRNTVSLNLTLADPPAKPENLTEPEADRKLED